MPMCALAAMAQITGFSHMSQDKVMCIVTKGVVFSSFGAIAERSHNTRLSAGSKKRLSYVRPTCTMRAHRTSLSLVQYRALPK